MPGVARHACVLAMQRGSRATPSAHRHRCPAPEWRQSSTSKKRINGTYSQSFAPNCLRGEQIGALFNSHSFCTVVVDVESLEDLCGRKKRQLCSVIAFGPSLGAPQKRIHANLSWSPQEQRVFEETFTD